MPLNIPGFMTMVNQAWRLWLENTIVNSFRKASFVKEVDVEIQQNEQLEQETSSEPENG